MRTCRRFIRRRRRAAPRRRRSSARSPNRCGRCPTSGSSPSEQSASQPSSGTTGSWMCTHVVAALAQLATHREHRLRRSATGSRRRRWRGCRRCARARRTPRCDRALLGARAAVQARARAHRRGRTARGRAARGRRAQLCRERLDVARDPTGIRPRIRRQQRDPHGYLLYRREAARRTVGCGRRLAIIGPGERAALRQVHVPEARSRLAAAADSDSARRTSASSTAACEDFADGHLLQAFSLVGTRGDAELLLISEAENLDRIHEFHVVLGRAG